jgi:hypothetical protein
LKTSPIVVSIKTEEEENEKEGIRRSKKREREGERGEEKLKKGSVRGETKGKVKKGDQNRNKTNLYITIYLL